MRIWLIDQFHYIDQVDMQVIKICIIKPLNNLVVVLKLSQIPREHYWEQNN